MLACLLACALPAAARPPTEAEVRAAVADFDAAAVYRLPALGEARMAALLRGEVVRFVDQPGGGTAVRRAMGLMLTDVPRDRMWLACQDHHFMGDPAVHELRLSVDPPDDAIWFGLADLPAPIADRRWVVRSWNNHALAAATGGRAWEHPWELARTDEAALAARIAAGELPAVDADMFAAAVDSPVNHGAFLAVALPGGHTLFGYHATFDPGGGIPDWLVARLAHAGLERGFRRYEARGRDVIPTHYGATHPPVVGGDGRPVAP
jgi:hypothetical protein